MNLDWLIIGGGLHGVHIAARLLGEGQIRRDRLRIMDPGQALLERWRSCTQVTGMTHLRSASVHHLDLDAWSLQRFAGKRKHRAPGLFAHPYQRPALELFNAHCDQVIDTFDLEALHLRDRALSCDLACDGATVQTLSGRTLRAQQLVLALGNSDQPSWPSWAPPGTCGVHHIFAPGFKGWPPPGAEPVAVLGAGISACQVALRLARHGHPVHLISRHALRQHQFDSDTGWLGPKYMVKFGREPDPDRRRAIISRARHRGSVPPDTRVEVRKAMDRGQITWHQSSVQALEVTEAGLRLELASGQQVSAERLLLATGFEGRRPGGQLVDSLIASANLPCARCGYPIVDPALRWHPRVYVSGPLAELELGPVSRNTAGARRAGDRLMDALRQQRGDGPQASLRAPSC
jgi:hypothetical protein